MTDTNKPYKILFLRLDPGETSGKPVEQDTEFSKVIYAAQDLFKVEDTAGFTLKKIVETINSFRPNIIHMSGHGSPNEVQLANFETILKGKPQGIIDLSEEEIERILGAYYREVKPNILFINACFAGKITSKIAESLQNRFDCTIGMSNLLNQKLALDIAQVFYTNLVRGDTVEVAVQALDAIIEAGKKEAPKDEQGYDPQPRVYGNKETNFVTDANGTDSPQMPSSTKIQILNLDNGSYVKRLQPIQGKVTVQNATEVWIVIIPEISDIYYVQKPANISNGNFDTKVYVGDERTPSNTEFKIRAFVNPTDKLSEGDQLQNWPKAAWSSAILSVKRI